MKKVLIFFALIAFLQIVNFLLMIPDYIPSWDNAISWFTTINYTFLLVIFIIMLVTMVRKNIQVKAKAEDWVKQLGVCLFSLIGLVIGAFFTFFIGADFMSNNKLLKQYQYKNAKATVYVFDTSFLDPEITVKVRNSIWPTLHEIKWMRESYEEAVVFDEQKDCLYIYDHTDTLVIDSKTVMSY